MSIDFCISPKILTVTAKQRAVYLQQKMSGASDLTALLKSVPSYAQSAESLIKRAQDKPVLIYGSCALTIPNIGDRIIPERIEARDFLDDILIERQEILPPNVSILVNRAYYVAHGLTPLVLPPNASVVELSTRLLGSDIVFHVDETYYTQQLVK